MQAAPCFVLSFVAVGMAGCSSAACRADLDVTRAVEREDQRRAQRPPQQAYRTAETAIQNLGPIELWSAAVEAITLLYVPAPETPDAGDAPAPPTGGAAARLAQQINWQSARPRPVRVEPEWESSFRTDRWAPVESAASAARSESRREANPQVRLSFLALRLNGLPVTVSASAKGLKGVQLRVKIRL
jgi:hypothetical protein